MIAHRRGFSLIEMVASMLILASLAVVGTQLLRTSLRVTHEAVSAQEMAARVNLAVGQLRRDVWNAKGFSSGGQSLHIEPPQGLPIDWSIDRGDLVRVEGGAQRRWNGVGADCLFKVESPSIILRSQSKSNPEQLRLISQLELASREDR